MSRTSIAPFERVLVFFAIYAVLNATAGVAVAESVENARGDEDGLL